VFLTAISEKLNEWFVAVNRFGPFVHDSMRVGEDFWVIGLPNSSKN